MFVEPCAYNWSISDDNSDVFCVKPDTISESKLYWTIPVLACFCPTTFTKFCAAFFVSSNGVPSILDDVSNTRAMLLSLESAVVLLILLVSLVFLFALLRLSVVVLTDWSFPSVSIQDRSSVWLVSNIFGPVSLQLSTLLKSSANFLFVSFKSSL